MEHSAIRLFFCLLFLQIQSHIEIPVTKGIVTSSGFCRFSTYWVYSLLIVFVKMLMQRSQKTGLGWMVQFLNHSWCSQQVFFSEYLWLHLVSWCSTWMLHYFSLQHLIHFFSFQGFLTSYGKVKASSTLIWSSLLNDTLLSACTSDAHVKYISEKMPYISDL